MKFMDHHERYDQYRDRFEDFWHRRQSETRYRRSFEINGCRIVMAACAEPTLQSVEWAAPLYSRAPVLNPGKELQVSFLLNDSNPGQLPENLFPEINYTANGDWFHIDFGTWGYCAADLRRGFAQALLAPELGEQPALVSRYLLNTLFTNYFVRNGFAMLHATGLVRNGKVLMLMAPHNSGKSTTALRLVLAGEYRLLTDSMVYVANIPQTGIEGRSGIQLTGFPVGQGKLRRDMLASFPDYRQMLVPEDVRDETKYILDLRAIDPALVEEQAVYPEEVSWCFLKRNGRKATFVHEASKVEAWEGIMENSLHYDEEEVWVENLKRLEPLVEISRFYHLEIGTQGDGIVEKILELDQ